MNLFFKLIGAFALVSQLAACAPAVVGGAAAGGAIAVDRRTSGIFLEDENIELKSLQKIQTEISSEAHVNITSYNRNVLLTGEVPNEEAKTKAESFVRAIENVRNITNELVIGPKTSLSSRSNDTYLTSKVKTKFVTENRFQANYVKIVTENSVVYLLGIVSKGEADAATDIARNTEGVSKVVKVFEYMN